MNTAAASAQRDSRRQQNEFNKLRKRLRRNVGNAIVDFNMIEEGDRLMVCVSGGKDSYAMLDILLHLRDSAPVNFEVIAVNLDQKQPGFPADVLPAYLEQRNIPYYILERDTYSVVKSVIPEGKQPAVFVHGCAAEPFMALHNKLAPAKLPLGTIAMTLLRHFFSICSSGASSKPCHPSYSATISKTSSYGRLPTVKSMISRDMPRRWLSQSSLAIYVALRTICSVRKSRKC